MFGFGTSVFRGRRHNASNPLTFDDITTLMLFDPNDVSSVTESDGLISAWSDLKGNGITLLPPLTKPQIGSTSLYGRKTAYFDGTNYMKVTDFNVPASGDVRFYIVADNLIVDDDVDSLFSLDSTASDIQFQAQGDFSFTGKINVSDIGEDEILTGGTKDGPSIFCVTLDFSSGYYNCHINGVKYSTDAAYTAKLNPVQEFILFSNRGEARHIEGECAFVLATEDCSEAGRQDVEGILAHMFGIAASLPADHAHKSSPPTV